MNEATRPLRFLFIVQGEGRGHLTQALSLADMLRRHGHEVVEVLVGKSHGREGQSAGARLRSPVADL